MISKYLVVEKRNESAIHGVFGSRIAAKMWITGFDVRYFTDKSLRKSSFKTITVIESKS